MTEGKSTPFVYLDANVFIFFLEGNPSASEPVKMLFDALRKHPGSGVTSELTLAEVLAGSEHPRSPLLKRTYLDLIVWSKFIDLAPVNRDVLYESAELRAMHKLAHGKKLDLPDAIHLVTAIQHKCRYFVSADKGISPPNEMTKISPDNAGVSVILKVFA